MKKLIILTFIVVLALPAFGLRWPLGTGNQPNRVGNNCYEYQNYGGSAYYHDGLDCLSYGGAGCYCVEGNWLRLKQNGDPLYSGIMTSYAATGDSEGWTYWHLTYATIPYNVGDYIPVNALVGNIATWPVAEFHHVHFTRSLFTGGWYLPVDNPIEFMVPTTDNQSPTFANAESGQLFSFCEDNSSTRVDPAAVSGNVDMIAKIADKIVDTSWDLVPYEIDWWINGSGGSVPTTLFLTFTDDCPPGSTVTSVVYKEAGIWDTNGDYDNRDYYFIVSNTDGDGVVETDDDDYYFDSTTLPDGDYTLYVRAEDYHGNSVTESMDFTIENNPQSDEGEDNGSLPRVFALYPPTPNPAANSAFIAFDLPRAAEVHLDLYDVKGRKVETLAQGDYQPGEYEVPVTGLNSGVYIYHLRADNFADTKKLVVK
ncbi:MAG: T9SS type A sorting domain-containing protein [bacterium]|nr:T9SS type A sorting domain-containing protein [bacterium]